MNTEDISALRRLCAAWESDHSLLSHPELSFFRCWVERTKFPPEEEGPPDDFTEPKCVATLDAEAAEETDPARKIHLLGQAISAEPSSRRYAKRAAALIEQKRYLDAKEDATAALRINPDYAAAYRMRATANWLMENCSDAYADMCESQRLDYCADDEILHREMKDACMKKEDDKRQSPRSASDFSNLFNNIDMEALMKNPQVTSMMQSIMNNPDAMNQILQGKMPI